ncbi:hypothetical protein AAG906_029127 [Vitis piasezkii]
MHQLRIGIVPVTLLLGAKIEAWLLKHRGDPTPRWVRATNQGSRDGVHNLGASTQDADSRLHRRLLESLQVKLREKEVEYLIPRNGRDGSFTKNSMAHSLSLVVLEEEDKIYRDKAKEMKVVFGDRNR